MSLFVIHRNRIQAPSVQFSQVCGKNLGQSFSSPSARILRRNYDFRRELVSVTRSMASRLTFYTEILFTWAVMFGIFIGVTNQAFCSLYCLHWSCTSAFWCSLSSRIENNIFHQFGIHCMRCDRCNVCHKLRLRVVCSTLLSNFRVLDCSFENREVLDSKSASPAIFDGTTRYVCCNLFWYRPRTICNSWSTA